jgi:hypothetical protein
MRFPACALSPPSPLLSPPRAQLQEALAAVRAAARGAAALRAISDDVSRLCTATGPSGASLRILQELSAAHANVAAVARSVRALQVTLPAALAALRGRLETYDGESGEDLEDAYEELSRLDVQGITAQRALEASARSGAASASRGGGGAAGRAVCSEAAMRRITAALAAAWALFCALLTAHMRAHARLAREKPGLLVRCARLAELHDAASEALSRAQAHGGSGGGGGGNAGGGGGIAAPRGVMHAPGAPGLRAQCIGAVRAAVADTCDALLTLDARPPPDTGSSSSSSFSSSAHVRMEGRAPVVVPTADASFIRDCISRASAALAAGDEFAAFGARCFPPAWRLRGWVVRHVKAAVGAHLAALAAAPDALSNDDILALLAWVQSVEAEEEEEEDNDDDADADADAAAFADEEEARAQPAAPLRRCVAGLRAVYVARSGDALRAWTRNIMARDAATPPQRTVAAGDASSSASASGVFLTAAPVDIFRLVHEQARVVADARAGDALCDDVAAMHLSVLDDYAAALAAAARAAGDAGAPGALEALCAAANNAALCGRKMEEEFALGGVASRALSPTTPSVSVADRAAATSAAFASAAAAALHRLSEIVFWDVEAVLWRLFTAERYNSSAMSSATSSASEGTHPALRAALATLDDYFADFAAFLLPPVCATLRAEAAKRAAVTFAALLLTGAPLSLAGGTHLQPGACADAARLCLADDIDALRTHFAAPIDAHARTDADADADDDDDGGGASARVSGASASSSGGAGAAGDAACRVPRRVLDACCEMMGVAVALACAGGPAAAQRAAADVRAQYGPGALPHGLLRRAAGAGVWAAFASKLPTLAEEEEEEAATQATPRAEAGPAEDGSATAPTSPRTRRRSSSGGGGGGRGRGRAKRAVSWLPWASKSSSKSSKLKGSAAASAAALAALPSFAVVDQFDAAPRGGDDDALRRWCASFFARVDALCVKRTAGARPADAMAAAAAGAEGGAQGGGGAAAAASASASASSAAGVGPWRSLVPLTRRATFWWGAGGRSATAPPAATAAQAPVAAAAPGGGGGGGAGGLDRRATSRF